jgi:hypothetical protein
MRVMGLALACAVLVGGCGKDPDFQPPPRDDMRVTLDLAVGATASEDDMTCFNSACGGCSAFANWDGTPVKVGDPCLFSGTWQCDGTALECSDNGCPACGTAVSGSVCGADGHTILELTDPGSGCRVYDFGSAVDVCNRSPGDHCVGRCTSDASGHHCVARCTSDDGGATGCEHMISDTCESLTSC